MISFLFRKTRRKARVESARVQNKKLTEKFSPAYDATISPLELRNHNLYVQSVQQRQQLHLLEPPLPSLHPNFHISKQKHVGGGGFVLQTKLIPPSSQVRVDIWLPPWTLSVTIDCSQAFYPSLVRTTGIQMRTLVELWTNLSVTSFTWSLTPSKIILKYLCSMIYVLFI